MLTAQDIIDKRKKIWTERQDLEYDRELVRASAIKILETPSLVEEIRAKPYLLIEIAFYIVDKKKQTVPFFLNEVQADFQKQFERYGTGRPYYVLKGRQQGFTSYITAMQLSFAIVRKNFSGFTLADKSDNTLAIFNDKARVVHDRLPDELKPTARFSSKKELFFDKLNSSWRVATASDQVGRSRTLNFVHFSEVAFYECSLAEMQKSIGEAMTADVICIYETTANGFNEAKDLWDSGSCHNLFYEWWRTSEYRSTDYQFLETKDPWLLERIEFLKEKGLDKDQITWYCKKYDGYLDKNTIKQEYPCSADEAFISSGNCVFDKEKVSLQLMRASDLQAVKKGYFTYEKKATPIKDSSGESVDVEWTISNIQFVEAADGYILLHELPKTKKDRDGYVTAMAPYVLGGDTAGGGEDFYAAKMISNLDGRTVATLHKQYIDEDLYAEQMYCLGHYYNNALIGIETNYSRYPMRVLQQKYNYPNIYMRERLDHISDRVEKVCGFETTRKTKPIIIGDLVNIIREDPTVEVDVSTLREMLVFVKNETGETGAINGYHDDLVMALAIAHFISSQQSHTWIAATGEEEDVLRETFNLEPVYQGNNGYLNWEDY